MLVAGIGQCGLDEAGDEFGGKGREGSGNLAAQPFPKQRRQDYLDERIESDIWRGFHALLALA